MADIIPYQIIGLERSSHWADRAAQRLLRSNPANRQDTKNLQQQKSSKNPNPNESLAAEEKTYVLAAGITPSGTVHIGNFREVMVVDLVERALQAMGAKTRFIFSWDNFDPLRKIPQNFPEKTSDGTPFVDYLSLPLTSVPDPEGKYSSYAERNQTLFTQGLEKIGISPQYIYETQAYTSGAYVEAIRESLVKRTEIREILNAHRSAPLDEDWFPIQLYCSTCRKSQTKVLAYREKYELDYYCKICESTQSLNFKTHPAVKLLWRIDWPMRWRHEGVDFEPGGKDHSNEGGSFDTAKRIAREIFSINPPAYLQYDFVLVKGVGAKMASSVGNVLTVDELLEVYEAEIVRYLYASQRPNVDFAIALDTDVLKHYEAFDRLEREYYGEAGPLPEKKAMSVKRLYELSVQGILKLPLPSPVVHGAAKADDPHARSENFSDPITKMAETLTTDTPQVNDATTVDATTTDAAKTIGDVGEDANIGEINAQTISSDQGKSAPVSPPFRPPFRHLTSVLQVYAFDTAKVMDYYQDQLRDDRDRGSLLRRIACATNWLKKYLSDNEEGFRFTLRTTPLNKEAYATLDIKIRQALSAWRDALAIAPAHENSLWRLDEKALGDRMYEIIHAHEVEPRLFFKEVYQILIGKEQGPRLASFLLTVGFDRVMTLFSGCPDFSRKEIS